MNPLLIDVFLIAAGPFVGSFVTATARAWPDWSRTGFARSACGGCGARLGPGELIPVLSFVLQRGRCRRCGAGIWPLHPVGEMLALLIGVAAALAADGSQAVLAALFGWTLLFAALADWRTLELPDAATLGLIPVGLGASWLRGGTEGALMALAAAAAGFLALAGIGWLYRRLRGRDGLGLGDAKLLAAAGAWSGPLALPWVVVLGAVVTLIGLAVAKARGVEISDAAPIPFGSGLALGAFAAHLTALQLNPAGWPGL